MSVGASADRGTSGDAARVVLGALLRARTGQQLSAGRAWRFETALGPLLAELSLTDVDALVTRLLDGSDATVATRIVDALLNQETSFFRDAGILEQAAEAVRDRGGAPGPVRPRIWCAACATGQEPLSLAMLFAEAGDAMPDIVATDVSGSALARARVGRFSHFEIQRGLPVRRMLRWFTSDEGERTWTAHAALTRAISWRRHNLVTDAVPGRFDLVLCRNVLFYLTPVAREQALERLAEAVRPGGLLLLGAGETVIGQSDAFRPSARRRGFYERIAAGQQRNVA